MTFRLLPKDVRFFELFTAFGELFGFVGILLAVPASALLKVVGEVVIARYRKTALYSAPPVEP